MPCPSARTASGSSSGSEGGNLGRFDLRNLLQGDPLKLPTVATQGPVEFVTISPDGTLLAVGIKSDRATVIDPLTLSTDVELRAMPNGDLIRRDRVLGLVRAAAFSPSGNLPGLLGRPCPVDLHPECSQPEPAAPRAQGQGRHPVRPRVHGRQPGGRLPAHQPPIPPTRRSISGYDFARQEPRRVTRDQLHRAIPSLNGWTLQGNIETHVLEAVNQNGRRWRFEVDPDTERNWWSYSMVPPDEKAGHPRPTVAVGCETGVIFCDLETGAADKVLRGAQQPGGVGRSLARRPMAGQQLRGPDDHDLPARGL